MNPDGGGDKQQIVFRKLTFYGFNIVVPIKELIEYTGYCS